MLLWIIDSGHKACCGQARVPAWAPKKGTEMFDPKLAVAARENELRQAEEAVAATEPGSIGRVTAVDRVARLKAAHERAAREDQAAFERHAAEQAEQAMRSPHQIIKRIDAIDHNEYALPSNLAEIWSHERDEADRETVLNRLVAELRIVKSTRNVPQEIAVDETGASLDAWTRSVRSAVRRLRPDMQDPVDRAEWPGILSNAARAAARNRLPPEIRRPPPPPPPLAIDEAFVSAVGEWLETIDAKYRAQLGVSSGRDCTISIGCVERILSAVKAGHFVAFEIRPGAVVPPAAPVGAAWSEAPKNAHPNPCLILKPAPAPASVKGGAK